MKRGGDTENEEKKTRFGLTPVAFQVFLWPVILILIAVASSLAFRFFQYLSH